MKKKQMIIGQNAGFSFVAVLVILIIIGAGYAILFMFNTGVIKGDMAKITKISNAIDFYYSKYNSLPGADKSGKMTQKSIYDALASNNLVIPEDFFLESVNMNLIFYGCEHYIDNKGRSLWKLGSLATGKNICLSRSDNKIIDYGTKLADTSSSFQYPAFMNSYTICQLETSLDDRNMYEGKGRFIKDGVNNAEIAKTGSFDCDRYSKEKNKIQEPNSSSYAFRVY